MKKIKLTQGQVALVDDEDYERLTQEGVWCAQRKPSGKFYAICNAYRVFKKANTRRMHRVIMNAKKGEQIDHVNGNGLDNRKCNLRIVTAAQNSMNKKGYSSTGYKGVTGRRGHFMCRIMIGGESTYLGMFDTKEEAAKVYDKKAKEYFGEYAYLNFPTTKDNENEESK